ncbi:MAG: adenylyl-sulfate reductase subunit alpha [Terriglobales bacterium]
MTEPLVEVVQADVIILGGGMAGCGAAFEAAYWAQAENRRVVLVEKSAIERSGAVAMGLSAINCYLGIERGENHPEDFLRYVRRDQMGLCRDDLVLDIARHVDGSVHLFESWGLPFFKTPDGRYQREGRWQVLIHGESYKPIVAEAARKALGAANIFEHVCVSHLLNGASGAIAGAVGFSLREPKIYVFLAPAVIAAAGGASGLFRPHAVGEGRSRTWYAPWNTGATYRLMLQAGAEMSQFEQRIVVPRFKDGYGPVGMWFLRFKAALQNAYGENVEEKWAALLADWAPYGSGAPIPTTLRAYQLLRDQQAGGGPHYLRTDEALTKIGSPQAASEAWENFLDMTVPQALAWAAHDVDPARTPSEITLTEPYLLGSHAGGAGAWVSGPEDLAPAEYFWGYNRMTTVPGLFAAGDGVAASAHKFSSGSYTEGRLAGKAAVAYVHDQPEPPAPEPSQVAAIQRELWRPFAVAASARPTATPGLYFDALTPRQALLRLQKLMDEYAAGISAGYATNRPTLERGLELLGLLGEDLDRLAATTLHDLLRCQEVRDRYWCAQAHARHLLFREETRWPGSYRRTDFPSLDDTRWRCFTNSRYAAGAWQLGTRPCLTITDSPRESAASGDR